LTWFFAGGGLDSFHVGVEEADVVADLVDEGVSDNVAGAVSAFCPRQKDRQAVEEDCIWGLGAASRGLSEGDTAVEAERVPGDLEAAGLSVVVFGEVIDEDPDTIEDLAEGLGGLLEGGLGGGDDVLTARGLEGEGGMEAHGGGGLSGLYIFLCASRKGRESLGRGRRCGSWSGDGL